VRWRRRHLLIAAAIVIFLAISFELARWLALENVERGQILALLTAQARGEAAVMRSDLHACGPRCQADVSTDARTLKRPGGVLILADQSQTAYSLGGTVGTTRVAWKSSAGGLPVVQCVRVSRTGNAISGLAITLLAVSLPLHPSTADC
jgi:hypothetical protein